MPEDVKRAEVQWTHLDVLMKAGGQITLGRMAPLDGVAAAVDDHNLYAVLRRKPEESFADLLPRLDEAVAIAQNGPGLGSEQRALRGV